MGTSVPAITAPYRPSMSCTIIPDSLTDLLAAVTAQPGVPIDQFDSEQFGVAISYGWVYEYRGRVGLTGAGVPYTGRGEIVPEP